MAKPKEDHNQNRVNSLFKDRRQDRLGKPVTADDKTKGQTTLLKARRDRLR